MIKDKLFLLSIEELKKYLPDEKNRICMYEGVQHWWWLRSPSSYANSAAYVSSNGYLDRDGYVIGSISAVRPALHLNLSYLQTLKRNKEDCVTFGNREWMVLDEETGLLISKDAMCKRRFDESSNNYEHSEIRGFLNKELIKKLFSAEEEKMIACTVIDGEVSYPEWLMDDGNKNISSLMGDKKIIVPKNVDASVPYYFHDLEIKLWDLLKGYMYKMDIIVDEPDEPDLVSVKAIQTEILNLIESSCPSVDFKWY